MDCKMVGVGDNGEDSNLARVSIVNYFGNCVYDKFVKPIEKVTNYRTEETGINPDDIENGAPFKIVRKEVSEILLGRVLVGHSLKNNLNVLLLPHPKEDIRDTSTFHQFTKPFRGETPTLERLINRWLSESNVGINNSVQDAKSLMKLYKLVRKDWEAAAIFY